MLLENKGCYIGRVVWLACGHGFQCLLRFCTAEARRCGKPWLLCSAACPCSKPLLRQGWHHQPVSMLVTAPPNTEKWCFFSHTAPQTWCNVVKGGYNHNRYFFSCGPETKPQLPVVLLQVLQSPGRRLHCDPGLAFLLPHSSFLCTYCWGSISMAHSTILGILVPCLWLLQEVLQQPRPTQALLQWWHSVSKLGRSFGCSFSLPRNPGGTSSSAPTDECSWRWGQDLYHIHTLEFLDSSPHPIPRTECPLVVKAN